MTNAVHKRLEAAVCEVFGLTPSRLWREARGTQLVSIARGAYCLAARECFFMSAGDVAKITGLAHATAKRRTAEVEALAAEGNRAMRRALHDLARALEVDPAELLPPVKREPGAAPHARVPADMIGGA